MKTPLHTCILTAALLAAPALAAQTAAPATGTPAPAAAPAAGTADASPDVIQQGNQKLKRISNIKTIQTNREFQRNVRVVQGQRDAARQLSQRFEQAFTTPEKEVIKKHLDDLVKNLEENNKRMVQTYGFSVTIDYVIQIVKSRIYEPLSEDEFKRLTQAEQNDADRIISRPSKDSAGKEITLRFKYLAPINGVPKNESFRQDAQRYQTFRQQFAQLTQYQPQAKTDEEKTKIAEALKKTEEEIKKTETAAYTAYGFRLKEGLIQEFEEINLYMPVTDEQLKQMEEEERRRAAAAPAAAPAPAPTPKP
ncbi:MAG: hypothetical protein LBT53_09825 [Puniceicoccales bacterium]|jgi:hypothetical protein|nr:hypothetical protein [Puniceicoccales bacterium]